MSGRCAPGLFAQATTQDPDDAPAWAGLANTHLILCEFGLCNRPADFETVRAAATRALALDPSLGDARPALAFAGFFWFWNARDADREFHAALAAEPNSAIAHHRYGLMLTMESRFSEALAQLDAAQKLDPTSTSILSDCALASGLSGHRDEAVQTLVLVERQQPDHPIVHHVLEMLYQVQPRNELAALEEARTVERLLHRGEDEANQDRFIRMYRADGEQAMWRARLAYAGRPGAHEYLEMATAQEALGQHDLALDTLERVVQDPGRGAIGIGIDPRFAELRGKPRFEALLASMGLPSLAPRP